MAAETPHNVPPDTTAEESLRVLEQFSIRAHVAFDRILASRALGEAERAIAGSTAEVWSQRLVEVGESLHLRVRSLDTTFDEMLTLARQKIPVATCLEQPGVPVRWLLITEVRGQRARVAALTRDGKDVWTSTRSLRMQLGLTTRTTPRRWVIGQAAFGCDAAAQPAVEHGGHKRVTPFARLMGLLRRSGTTSG